MKKLLIILLAGIFIIGCSSDGDDTGKKENDEDQATETNEGRDENAESENEKKEVYQIGETAKTTSSSYGFPYEITVNDFKLTSDEIDGYSFEDFHSDPDENHRFAVINVTIKNTGDESFVPNDKISAQLLSEITSEISYDEFFTERDEELEPGQEITGDLIYMSRNFFEEEFLYLTYEAAATDEEVKFELPVPEK